MIYFAAIKDANFAIDAIAKSSLTDDVKQKTTAEALFYRALFKFQLTLQYGDVPYWAGGLDINKVSLLVLNFNLISLLRNSIVKNLSSNLLFLSADTTNKLLFISPKNR